MMPVNNFNKSTPRFTPIKIGLVLIACIFTLVGLSYGKVIPVKVAKAQSAGSNRNVYLPLIDLPAPRQLMLGIYTDGYLGLQSVIDNEVKAVDTWSGKRLSIVGTFIAIEDLNPDYNIRVPLGLLWDSGYTPFVNLNTGKSLNDINSGNMDAQITNMALAFKNWRGDGLNKGQNRKAFLAPLEEMNGNWVSYYGTPAAFKAAFTRIQNIFNRAGAGSAVRWVFAPNGWSDPSSPQFEDYYPGDASVEVIAFSGYNSGYCPSAAWKSWSGPEAVFGSYIQRMRTMAPSKPIFIAQTATTAYDSTGFNTQSKNNWLIDAYKYLAATPGVAGILYFNKQLNQSCDWPFYLPNGPQYDGYRQGVSNKAYIYLSPEELSNKILTP